MAKATAPYTRQTFISLFDSIARHKHRYTVFSDFVFMAAITFHNAICKSEALEKEYLEIVARYSKPEVDKLCELLANFIELMEAKPMDILGSLYMELEISNLKNGQFFSPHEISLLMAKITFGDVLEKMKNDDKPLSFITLSEPACGAGGMVLAFASEMIQNRVNPAEKLFVQCIDIDRLAAFMCYLQLTLWNIPAQIIVGDTLKMEWREVYYTPAYYLWDWDFRLKARRMLDFIKSTPEPAPEAKATDAAVTKPQTNTKTETKPEKTKKNPSTVGLQGDLFDFLIDH